MSETSWRLDPIGHGAIAWLYVRPHAVSWDVPETGARLRRYTVTEERQNLVDDEMGACTRYLAVPASASPGAA